jgi:hypothetical protein
MVSGASLVALVVPGCPGCERLHREIDAAGGVPLPFYVIGDPDVEGVEHYLATWTTAQYRIVAPVPTDELVSFAHPRSVPAVMVVKDGVIEASGYRLIDVAQAMQSLLANPAGRRSGR